MQGKQTHALKAYLNPRTSSADRDILARLLADHAHGKTTSAVIRAALAEHYGLQRRSEGADNAALERIARELDSLRSVVMLLSSVIERQAGTQSLESAKTQEALVQCANLIFTALGYADG